MQPRPRVHTLRETRGDGSYPRESKMNLIGRTSKGLELLMQRATEERRSSS